MKREARRGARKNVSPQWPRSLDRLPPSPVGRRLRLPPPRVSPAFFSPVRIHAIGHSARFYGGSATPVAGFDFFEAPPTPPVTMPETPAARRTRSTLAAFAWLGGLRWLGCIGDAPARCSGFGRGRRVPDPTAPQARSARRTERTRFLHGRRRGPSGSGASGASSRTPCARCCRSSLRLFPLSPGSR
jgi:hypothetical protein